MSEGKVRILADVSPQYKRKLEEVVFELNMTKKDFFEMCIDQYHEKHVKQKTKEN